MTNAHRQVVSTGHIPGLMLEYQYEALYRLALHFDGGRILEIGCYQGRSALVMALAAPRASILTMSPDAEQVVAAKRNTRGRNVKVIKARSWDYLKRDNGTWDMIFVDGNHLRVMIDMPWFNRLRIGGLILFHDYTPLGAGQRAHVEVCEAVDMLGAQIGRKPDVLIVGEQQEGMAGFYRREGEMWQPTS